MMFAASAAMAVDAPGPGLGPGANGARYATDAYPGFDNEDDILKPERKEPKWFSFLFGPNRTNAKDQMEYCEGLMKEGDFSKARSQLDALVREWPTSPEAPRAQKMLADVCLNQFGDTEDAFAEYRYLLDFYSLGCDYDAVATEMFRLAGVLRTEGKEVMFVRFENTVDSRRAYETCVLRAPGAKWVPEAMLTIAQLREEEGKHNEAVQVYENLRNIRAESDEAKVALVREAEVRMFILRERGYNRLRCRDTVDFLILALRTCREEDAERIRQLLEEAQTMLEAEAYLGAKFYDSKTRTRRSAIAAYEGYLKEYPDGAHAEEVRARLEQMKGEAK